MFLADLAATYKRLRKEHLLRYGRISRPALNLAVANAPAKRFYVGEGSASRIISAMLGGKDFPKMQPTKREMYLEILSRIRAKLRSQPNRSIPSLLEEILAEPAPKFYITPQSVNVILCRTKEKKRPYKKTGKYRKKEDTSS